MATPYWDIVTSFVLTVCRDEISTVPPIVSRLTLQSDSNAESRSLPVPTSRCDMRRVGDGADDCMTSLVTDSSEEVNEEEDEEKLDAARTLERVESCRRKASRSVKSSDACKSCDNSKSNAEKSISRHKTTTTNTTTEVTSALQYFAD